MSARLLLSTPGRRGARRWAAALLVSATAWVGLGLAPPPAQAAVEQHLFDPTLSLTGACGTEKYDEVPDPWCPGPPKPSKAFENPNIAIDSFGDMYVSSRESEGTAGRVDVFRPEGRFITELQVSGARALAVDPKGNLYVHQFVVGGIKRVTLFRPTGTYDPEAGEIAYEGPGEVFIENDVSAPTHCSDESASFPFVGLAVDPETERLFVSPGEGCVGEWSPPGSSAGEPPQLLDPAIGRGTLNQNNEFVAVDHRHRRLYVSDQKPAAVEGGVIQVFELEGSHDYLGSIDGRGTPNGKLLAPFGRDTIAVDEESGHLIVSELDATPKVYEFGIGLGAGEELLETYEYPGFRVVPSPLQVAVDNAATSPNHRSFFVPSEGKPNHTFAFRFSSVGAPEVQSLRAAGVTETEAILQATVNPNGGRTTYRLEYTTAPSGFDGATLAGQGTLPSGIAGIPVSAPIAGLAPGTTYRFRAVAENECIPGGAPCREEVEGSFTTYAPPQTGGPCANGALRTGPSAMLPDCRAYELVTPPDTNGRTPRGAAFNGRYFPTLQASPDGDRVSFLVEGGSIPGFEAAGAGNGDDYLARRGGGGWSTELASPTGAEVPAPRPGAFSEDQEHSLWSESLGAGGTTFIRYPDGHSQPVGRGSLGVDRGAEARLIAPGGSHTIFSSERIRAVQLEPDAPPAGTAAIYDRTADEVTHVVSLLPGDVTPAAGENAEYVGASLDGAGVAFRIEGSGMLYLRQDDARTYAVGEGLTYAGIAEGGGRIFYLEGGDLFAYDAATGSPIRFSEGGDTTPVNVSPDGRIAYFLSPDVLTGQANPNGAHAETGKDNLYVSREGQIGFVGTVEEEDVEETIGAVLVGLGRWLASLGSAPARETSRTDPGGDVLLFESRAPLTSYDPAGHKEVYRYDGATLSCLSCNPTGTPATGGASLQTPAGAFGPGEVLGLADRLLNLNAEGTRAFFQSYEPLVAADTDQRQDVYEWEASGLGSCARPGGCLYLISGPHSEADEHLFAVSADGDDVFFLSGDLLTGTDTDTTPSIYDARVNGGFPEAAEAEACQGDGCRPAPTLAPQLPTAATSFPSGGNATHRRCPKGKHKARRHGKTRCVAKKHRHRRHRRQRTSQKSSSK
ncbi:MAG TPA: hypothetical protein VHE08_07260 [Solirubrobacterales bacterium]|nr:hypothetical protein [Solirubrobacterales bacterium]